METIKELFKDKNFGKEELRYIENAIKEFEIVFGKYVSKDDLIDRIKRNIDSIEFTNHKIDDSNTTIGRYLIKDKCILIRNSLLEELKKSTFFHEFLHAIAVEGKNTGFYKDYDIVFNDDEKDKVSVGRGWNEGFVQMMTEDRDKAISNKVVQTGYPILTASVKKFTNVFGKEQLLDLYFNNPDGIEKVFKENNIKMIPEFLHDFDSIYDYEKEILEQEADMLLEMVFEYAKNDQKYRFFNEIKERIIQKYVNKVLDKKIEDTEEFKKFFYDINDMYKIFKSTMSPETIEKIIDSSDIKVLNNINQMPDKIEYFMGIGLLHKEFSRLNHSDKLKMLMDDKKEYLKYICTKLNYRYARLSTEYFTLMLNELYEGYKDFSDVNIEEWIDDFINITKYIKENNLSFDNLKIDSDYYLCGNRVFNIYNYQENDEYKKVATIVSDDSDEIKEYKSIDDIEQLEDLNNKVKEENLELIEAFGDENGNYVINCGEEQLFLTSETDELLYPLEEDKVSVESLNRLKIKQKENRLNHIIARINKYKQFGAPDSIIEDDRNNFIKLKNEIAKARESIRKNAIMSKQIIKEDKKIIIEKEDDDRDER